MRVCALIGLCRIEIRVRYLIVMFRFRALIGLCRIEIAYGILAKYGFLRFNRTL